MSTRKPVVSPVRNPQDERRELVLLIDAEQRPSRRSLQMLTEQAAALKEKRVAVIILQATSMADTAYAAWLQEEGDTQRIGEVNLLFLVRFRTVAVSDR